MLNLFTNKNRTRYIVVGVVSLLSFFWYAYAANTGTYRLETVHVFPGKVVSQDWNNVDSVRHQNLGSLALYQEFNGINSATLDDPVKTLDNTTPASEPVTQNSFDNRSSDEDASSPSTTPNTRTRTATTNATSTMATSSVEKPEVSQVLGTTTAATTSTETPRGETTTANPSSTASDAGSTTSAAESAPEPNVSTTSEATASSGTTTAVFSVPREAHQIPQVHYLWPFVNETATQTTTTATRSTTTDVAQEETSETRVGTTSVSEVVVENRATTTSSQRTAPTSTKEALSPATTTDTFTSVAEVPQATTSTSSTPVKENPRTEAASRTTSTPTSTASTPESGVDASTTSNARTTTTTQSTSPATTKNVCTENCDTYSMTLSEFGVPVIDADSDVELGGGQLRFSLGSKMKERFADQNHSFSAYYSFDGGKSWQLGGELPITDETTNGTNGGYFLFGLPSDLTVEMLYSLEVELRYTGDKTQLEELYLEGVWLELFTIEPPDEPTFTTPSDDREENGYDPEPLSGDVLDTGNERIEFSFTDNNEDETLLIKSSAKDYAGLSEAMTYFSVTNTSDRSDTVQLQTYFPKGMGRIEEFYEWNQNSPVNVTVPEYRPYVYHCKGGWSETQTPVTNDIFDLSRQFSVPVGSTTEATPAANNRSATVPAANDVTNPATTSAMRSPATNTVHATDTSKTHQQDKDAQSTSTVPTTPVATTSTSTALFSPVSRTFLRASAESSTSTSLKQNSASSTHTAADAGTGQQQNYVCQSTNVVRSCDEVRNGTDCHVPSVKVNEYEVTKYRGDWENRLKEADGLGDPGLWERTTAFFGFGPNKKTVPEHFEPRSHTPEGIDIAPGETKYFKMKVSYPPKSYGEFWIEAIGSREYGLLDPFWQSAWRKRLPLTIDNTGNASSTEQQVFLELDNSLTGFWNNVQSDGGDIRFVQESGGNSDSWYDNNWSHRTPITIQASAVDEALTDFPVYIDLSTLGDTFWNEVQGDGDDIRVTNSSGTTELAYELVSFDSGNETGEMYFAADSLASSTDTTFYIYHGNASASGYAVTDTYGAEAVWNNGYHAVYHFGEDPSGSAPQAIDSTANGYDMTTSGMDAADLVTGQIGDGYDFDGVNDFVASNGAGTGALSGSTAFSVSFWSEADDIGSDIPFLTFETGSYADGTDDFNILRIDPSGFLTSGTNLYKLGLKTANGTVNGETVSGQTTTAWTHLGYSWSDGGEPTFYQDGSNPGYGSGGAPGTLTGGLTADILAVGRGNKDEWFDGVIDEFRLHDTDRSAAWFRAEYEGTNNPTAFYSTSTAETLTQPSFSELDHWVQHFDYSNQEADIWVQVDKLKANASTTIYLYYDNTEAESTSDEYAPFTYSTSTDLYYVVDGTATGNLELYSLIDNNEIWVDGQSLGTLNAGETVSTSTYASSSVVSALGPISSIIDNDSADMLTPIGFATTTFVIPTERNTSEYFIHAPRSTAAVDTFLGGASTPDESFTVPAGATVQSLTDSTGESVIVESDEPILVYHRNTSPGDSLVAYPPTTRAIYGVASNGVQLSSIADNPDPDVYCSGGASGTSTGILRGDLQVDGFCATADQGTGDAVRFAKQTSPLAALQQADADGRESTAFWPELEFGTEYIMSTAAQYTSIVCSPRFGTVDIEVQSAAGTTLASGTCTPGSSQAPGLLHLGDSGVNDNVTYAAGSRVVSTNGVPFYAYYESVSVDSEETNLSGAVQARKFAATDFAYTIGAEEENTDAQYEQNNYRWYENNDSLTPSSAWPSETGSLDEREPITGQNAVNPGNEVRLRMNLLANNGTGTIGSTAFSLQYAEAETCSAVPGGSWRDLGDIGSTTADFVGYDASPADSTTLPSTVLTDSDVVASYEEENFSASLPNEVGDGQVVEFDWAITPVSGAVNVNSDYCFRMVRSSGLAFPAYTEYPQLLTAGPPEQPTLLERFDNEHATSTTPELEFVAVDVGGDEINYQLQLGTDNSFGSTVIDETSNANFDFENAQNPSDKAPFNNGQRIRYTVPNALNNGTTYYWRVRAIDPDGSNTYGQWSETFSFTTNTGITVSEWFQTDDEQFETNSLTSATTSGSGSVTLDIAGSNLVGEYGTVSLTNGATSTVSLNNSYTNPVVVASIRYPRSISSPNQPALRVFNKTGSGFDIIADNFSKDSVGTSTADYMVMEAGDWLLDNGGTGVRVFATSTSVSTIDGNTIASDPGGPVVTYPTSFSATPALLTMVTTNNDPQWVVSSVYDGNNISNPPTASQVGLYLNDNLDSNGHGSAEDIDVIAFDIEDGSNNGIAFDTQTTAADVNDTPNTKSFTPAFSSTPGLTLVQQLTMNGGQGGYAQVDTDNPATASDVTVSIDEGGSGADRNHADESVGIVAFAAGSGDLVRTGNGQVVSTPINFADADVGNAWGEVDFTVSGDTTVRVQYRQGGGFVDVPDSDLPGNGTGFSSGPINILSLDTETYSELRLVADLSGVNPTLSDWTVRWGQRVDTPTLGDPFDNEKTADQTPRFDFTTNDPQGDDLTYEISYSTDPTFSSGSTTISSAASSSDFSNLTSGGDTAPFNSGDQISYTVPAGAALTDGETYWWRVRAKDPTGSDAFSPWSDPDNFTVDSSTVVSSWFQTTQAQFTEGVIDGVIASTSDSVTISDEVGEYGSTTVTDNAWTTISTELKYEDMVVVASPKYDFNSGDNGRTVQVRNKTTNSFEIKAENYTESLSGSTDVNYVVMEAGDWILSDGGTGMRLIAGTASAVSTVNGSNIGYSQGTQITFSPAFGTTPAALSTVSTANGNEWVSARVDDGTEAGEVTASDMYVSLGSTRDTDVTRDPEDIDYVVFASTAGTNNSVLFDAFNTADVVTDNEADSTVTWNQTFSSAPQSIVVQNNGMDGGDGGTALQDTGGVTDATEVSLSIAEHGPGAAAHTQEIVSVLAFADQTGTIVRSGATAGGLTGTIASEEVLFSDGAGPKFDVARFSGTTPGNSTTSIQIEYQTATGSWALIPDTQVPNNSVGLTSSPVNLSNIDVQTYPIIRLRGTLQCDSGQCPTLDDWTVEWSEGVNLSGNLKQYDRLTNVANATITAAVNGTAVGGTATTDAGGDFTLGNVTAFAGDTVTVYVDGAAEANEAVATFIYDGLGDMSGVQLYEGHLSIAADETTPATLGELAQSDNSAIGDEDVFFDVNGSGDLDICAVGSCTNNNLYVGLGNTFTISTSTTQSVTTHDLVNDGTVNFDSNTIEVSGSWENNATTSLDTSSVVFTATGGTETISDTSGILSFYNLTFGQGSGSASWQVSETLDVDNDLAVNYGTLNRGTVPITVAGALRTGVSGFWNGLGTTTFDGTGTNDWDNTNPTPQNIGHVVVDGAARTVLVGNDVQAESITIGSDDTLNAGGAHAISVAGNFINNNTFAAQTSEIVITGTSTNAVITAGGSSLYSLRASSTNGSVSFTEPSVTALGDVSIATGTVNLPTNELAVGGSFTNTGGNFAHNNAEVRFTGSGNNLIQQNGTTFLNAFYDVRFTGDGSWSYVDANATTTNQYRIENGNVVFPSGQHAIGRDFTTSGSGSFDANGGELVLLIKGPDQVNTNGSALHDVRVRSGGGTTSWYDEDWTYRVPFTVNASGVDTDLTDFPVYVDFSDFATSFFSNVNGDGGDIRVTESDGVTEVPREVVSVSSASSTGEMYFLAPSLSSTTDTTFYVYYGNSGATEPAATDTNGRNAVWQNGYLAVYHLPTTIDSTGNGHTLTAANISTVSDTLVGDAADFNGSNSVYTNSNPEAILDGHGAFTLSMWFASDLTNTDQGFFRASAIDGTDEDIGARYDQTGASAGASETIKGSIDTTANTTAYELTDFVQTTDSQYFVQTWQAGSALDVYINASSTPFSSPPSSAGGTTDVAAGTMYIGAGAKDSASGGWDGRIDEVRMASSSRSAGWLSSEYRNQATTTDFYSVGMEQLEDARTFVSDTVATGDVVIESGRAVFPSGDLTIEGSFDNNSTFDANGGRVQFAATGGSHTVAPGTSVFHDLQVNSTGGTLAITENATATNAIDLQNSGSFAVNNGVTLESTGTFANDLQNASSTWNAGSVLRLSGGTDFAVNGKTADGDDYAEVELTNNTDISWWNSSASTYNTHASSSIYSQDHAAVDGDLYIFGDYARQSGTEYWSYATDFDGTDLSGGSERQVNVRGASSTTVLIDGAALELVGSSTASTTVDAQNNAFSVIASSTTVSAEYFSVDNLDAAGLELVASTTITTLRDALFTVTPGRTGITLDGSTVDANPAAQFARVDFATTTAGAANNVTLTGAAPSSFVWFRNGSANLYGESFDAGDADPGSVRWDDSNYQIDVSGTVYSDAGTTVMGAAVCDGSTQNLRIVVDGGAYTDTTSCDGSGNYTFTNVSYNGDPVIVVYLDTDGGENGSVITKTPTANITDLDVYANRVMTRHEDTVALTIADMVAYDEVDDSDLRFVVATGTPDTLTVRGDTELVVASSTTFAPDGNLVLGSSGSGNGYDGSLRLMPGAALAAAGTESHQVGGSFFAATSSTLTAASSTFAFTATTTGKGITNDAAGTLDFHELEFTGVGGSWNLNDPITVAADMTIATGTVTGTGDITMRAGELTGAGLLSMGGGTTTIQTSTTLGGVQGWTFNDLVLGTGATTSTTTRSNIATTTIGGSLTIRSGHTLDTGNSVWDLAGTGTVLVEDGLLQEDTSTFVYSGNGASVHSTDYYNLRFAGAAGTPNYLLDALGIRVRNNLTVAGTVPTTVDLDSNDPLVQVDGDVRIETNGEVSASSDTPLRVKGSYTNNGTFTANGGTVRFAGTAAYSIDAGNSGFANLTLASSGPATITASATTTESFLVATSSDLTVSSSTTLALGGTGRINSSSTDWTGATLAVFGSDQFTLNPKSLTVPLADITLRESAQMRTWNVAPSSVVTKNSAGLYSQDHAGVDGNLYIYGTYAPHTPDDHWSYGTDFDGADLSGGSERRVDVYLAANAVANWNDGSISVHGTTTASTTMQNQGSGTYSITIGGVTQSDWSYATVRDIDADGVTFTGTPDVVDFSHIDLLAEINSATTMTVGGSAITASPARNFTDVQFAAAGGVTGATNVTATGTTLSGWRFTGHSGGLDGETNDVDPGGDPGYVIWDDSAAVISISGHVYEADGTTVSSVCDGSTDNIRLAIAGSIAQNASSSCSSSDGSYTISGVSFGASDELTLYIDGEAVSGATVSRDPVSSIANMNVYENHVIVRHESNSAIDIANLAVWDSSDDADIPFTAITGSPNSVTLPADTKLLVWNDKQFTPDGNVTVSGGGSGASFDGSLEVQTNASYEASGSEQHTFGGNVEFANSANFVAASSSVAFTSDNAGKTIAVQDQAFHDLSFTGAGSWSVTDSTLTVKNNFDITSGAVTLPNATTTIGGSFTNSGTFVSNGSPMVFTADTSGQSVTLGGSDAAAVSFTGLGEWTVTDTNATATDSFTVATGTVDFPSGTLAVGGDFVIDDTVNHSNGTVALTNDTGTTTLALANNDLSNLTVLGQATTTMVDQNATLLGDLTVTNGAVVPVTDTLSIGGSFDATSGVFAASTGTVLFNSTDTGEIVAPGTNSFVNLVFAGFNGGWTVSSATTTQDFLLQDANSFSVSPGSTFVVDNVFQNAVGGANTDWGNSTIRLRGALSYSINSRNDAGDEYDTLVVEDDADIRTWYSVATSTTIATSSSWYSQDHAGGDGQAQIYGDFVISTSTEYWNYAADFDGTNLTGGSERAVTITLVDDATTTVTSNGTLNMVGDATGTTTVQHTGSGTYNFAVDGGTINWDEYAFRDLPFAGIQFSGAPNIVSLRNGDYGVNIDGGTAIDLDIATVNANPSLQITGTQFATYGAANSGTNVRLSATSTNAWRFVNSQGSIAGENFDVDGVSECGSIRWDDSSCLLVEQTAYRWRNDDGAIGVPDSEWFDSGFAFRQQVRVANNDNTTYSDAVVRLTVPYDSDMQSDFSDLRFTTKDGQTLTDFWIEKQSLASDAEVWAVVPNLPAGDTTSLFMYYGSSTANSVSSSTAVFDAVASFEDNSLAEYSGDTTQFETNTTRAYGGSYSLQASNPNDFTNNGIARFDQTVSQGETIRSRVYVDTGSGDADEVCTLFAVQSPITNHENYGLCIVQFGTERMSLAKDIERNDTFGGVNVLASTTQEFTTSGWYEIEIDWRTDNTMDARVFDPNDNLIATTTASDSAYSSGGYGFTFWSNYGAWDGLLSRPLLEQEPTIYFGNEQSDGGATYASNQNTPTTAFSIGDTARVRLAVENTGLSITDQNFQLEVAPKDTAPSCAAVPEPSFTPVPSTGACTNEAICMASSTVANNTVTTDLLDIDRNEFVSGRFVSDTSNQSSALDLDQNRYTELEYAIEITSNATDPEYCFRATDAGTALDAYTNLPELSLSFDPSVAGTTLNGGDDIMLVAGTTTPVLATSSVSDLNGAFDLDVATTTFYRSGVAGGANCTPDNNNCYVTSTTDNSCSFVGCSGTTCELQCEADIWFHADPTDAGSFAGEDWYAFAEVEDQSDRYDFDTSLPVELLTMRALEVDSSINYGTLDPASDTGTFNPVTAVNNVGNVAVQPEVEGQDLTDGFSSNIPAENQRLATSTFDYGTCTTCVNLTSGSSTDIGVDLNKPTAPTPPEGVDVYWGIEVPFSTAPNPHQGSNIFYAVGL